MTANDINILEHPYVIKLEELVESLKEEIRHHEKLEQLLREKIELMK